MVSDKTKSMERTKIYGVFSKDNRLSEYETSYINNGNIYRVCSNKSIILYYFNVNTFSTVICINLFSFQDLNI